ncbi:MAG: copper chaperone PCu(A)C [Actinomycetota bacterium]
MRRKQIAILTVLVALAGCSGGETGATDTTPSAPASGTGPQLVIEGPWSLPTPPIEDGTGIVYMVFRNEGGAADRLVAAKTPMAAAVELHIDEIDANGVMHMHMVDGGVIDFPPGETVVLEPAGLHIMLIELTEPLAAGTTYPLTLKFEQSGEFTLDVPVTDEAPELESADPIVVPAP